ncbi:MAG: hypothetical protein FWD16_06830, partial [Clostridia bacterium]|nr:hypothetical protein [Clostridia bacterium]
MKTNLAREFHLLFKRQELKICITVCFVLAAVNFLLNLPPLWRWMSDDLLGAFQNTMIFYSPMVSVGPFLSATILPLLCGFLYADSYHAEKKNGYFVSIRSRLSNSQYLWGKACVIA